jgi:FdhD protein
MHHGTIEIPKSTANFRCDRRDPEGLVAHERLLAEETPIALVYGGSTEAVMMATPADLEDFAVGFSLTEGLVGHHTELRDLTVVMNERGVELRMWLAAEREAQYRRRRRRLTGPTGCGLCGIESLSEAIRPSRPVQSDVILKEADIVRSLTGIASHQRLSRLTRATHAAGFYIPGGSDMIVREDVGRHNALDKLAGALHRGGAAAGKGILVITSRVSVEMVQKAAAIGSPILIAMSAPTALAVRTATESNITLVAAARGDTYQVFCHGERIISE